MFYWVKDSVNCVPKDISGSKENIFMKYSLQVTDNYIYSIHIIIYLMQLVRYTFSTFVLNIFLFLNKII